MIAWARASNPPARYVRRAPGQCDQLGEALRHRDRSVDGRRDGACLARLEQWSVPATGRSHTSSSWHRSKHCDCEDLCQTSLPAHPGTCRPGRRGPRPRHHRRLGECQPHGGGGSERRSLAQVTKIPHPTPVLLSRRTRLGQRHSCAAAGDDVAARVGGPYGQMRQVRIELTTLGL